MSDSLPKYPPSKADWDRHSPTIAQLYREHTLKNVMAIMEELHGFRATERMYKARLPALGVHKYRRGGRQQRSQLNVTTRSHTQEPGHGRTTTSHDITSSLVLPSVSLDAYPQQVRIPTFSLPAQLSPTPFGGALSTDDIVSHIRQYTEARFQNEPVFSPVISHQDHQQIDAMHNELFFKIYKALALLELTQKDEEAFALLSEACGLVHDVLRSQPLLFFRAVFMVFDTNRWNSFQVVRSSLLKYLARMASTLFNSDHPMTRVLQALRGPDALRASAELSLRSLLSIVEREHGPVHQEALRTKRNLAIVLRRQDDLDRSEELIQTAITACETQLGATHVETLRCLRRLASLYIHHRRYEDAEALLIDALHQARTKDATSSSSISTRANTNVSANTDSDIDTLVYATHDLARIAMQQEDLPKTRLRLHDFAWVCENKLRPQVHLNPDPVAQSSYQHQAQASQHPSHTYLPYDLTIVDAETRIKDLVMKYDLHCDELASRLMSGSGSGSGPGQVSNLVADGVPTGVDGGSAGGAGSTSKASTSGRRIQSPFLEMLLYGIWVMLLA